MEQEEFRVMIERGRERAPGRASAFGGGFGIPSRVNLLTPWHDRREERGAGRGMRREREREQVGF
jgi:hypothetical protein